MRGTVGAPCLLLAGLACTTISPSIISPASDGAPVNETIACYLPISLQSERTTPTLPQQPVSVADYRN